MSTSWKTSVTGIFRNKLIFYFPSLIDQGQLTSSCLLVCGGRDSLLSFTTHFSLYPLPLYALKLSFQCIFHLIKGSTLPFVHLSCWFSSFNSITENAFSTLQYKHVWPCQLCWQLHQPWLSWRSVGMISPPEKSLLIICISLFIY